MSLRQRIFSPSQNLSRRLTTADGVLLLALGAVLALGTTVATWSPKEIAGPEISLSPFALPAYSLLSMGRMLVAYVLALSFSLAYGAWAANSPQARKVLLPALDVLQSVPILSFLPVVLLSLAAVLPQKAAAEIASILLIFTSQAWNLTFSWYQSLTTIPKDLREASRIFGLNPWLAFRSLQLPFGAIGLIWNSMMSWAGGWFFLMAAEIFHLGSRDFRLPGLGSYLQEAAGKGDLRAIMLGLLALVVAILALDQFVWRPLLAWSDRFRLDTVGRETPPVSWFHDLLMGSDLVGRFRSQVLYPLAERVDARLSARCAKGDSGAAPRRHAAWAKPVLPALLCLAVGWGSWLATRLLVLTAPSQWLEIGAGLLATSLRVGAALGLALAWTIPLGVAIGTSPRLARWLQPVTQLAASIPATAVFPVILMALVSRSWGLDVAAIVLMMAGTQWYLLFNVIAGASTIPQDLRYTSALMHLRRGEQWRVFILPSLFPYIVTGAITASGGAWNASIVAEYVLVRGEVHRTVGVGASIAQATAAGDYPMLLASTLAMVGTVVLVNRLVWRRLYTLAQSRFRMD